MDTDRKVDLEDIDASQPVAQVAIDASALTSRNPSRQTSPNSSPWELLGFYPDVVQKYLEANQTQLQRLSKVKPNALQAELVNFSTKELQLVGLQHDIRAQLAGKVQELHNNVESVATLIVELEKFREEGNHKLLEECYAELHQSASHTKSTFDQMREFFTQTFEKHMSSAQGYRQVYESVNFAKWTYGSAAMAVGLPALAGLGGLFLCGGRNADGSRSWGLNSAIKGWISRFLRDDGDRHDLTIVFYPFAPFVCLVGSMWSIRSYRKSQIEESVNIALASQTNADMEFLQMNKDMWAGMNHLVEEVLKKEEYFQSLNKTREDRVIRTMCEISERLFNMLMSVDVYMVWLAKHNMFPANVSIPMIVGMKTHCAISSTLVA